jgi:hypothetical protein
LGDYFGAHREEQYVQFFVLLYHTTRYSGKSTAQDDVNSSKPLTLSPASLQKAVDLYYSQLNAEACSPEKPSSLSAAQLRDGASSFPLEKAFPRTAHNAFSPPAELNTYETALVPNLYSPGAVGIKYSDIGSHDSLKEMLYELVTLPIQRQELFKRGLLAKSISGILLFGPPGTGWLALLVNLCQVIDIACRKNTAGQGAGS